MERNNYTYVIINASEINSIDFEKVMQHSAPMLRYNKSKTKTFVKFEGDTPSFLTGKTEYTHSEILAILDNESGEWYIEDE